MTLRPAPRSPSIWTAAPATGSASACRIRRSSRRSRPACSFCSMTARSGWKSVLRRSSRRRTRVVVGGTLSDRKGVSVVGAVLPLSALTPKDRTDLAYALELGVDWIALSFVQRPEDVRGNPRHRRRPGRGDLQAGEALSGRASRRHRRALGRGHGGARRPRRGDAARAGAADPAAHRPRLPAGGQALHRRDPDAGIDDPGADADPRRGVRRGVRHLPRRRCGDAVGGIGVRTVPAGGGRR